VQRLAPFDQGRTEARQREFRYPSFFTRNYFYFEIIMDIRYAAD
jgi:hypothetical protein